MATPPKIPESLWGEVFDRSLHGATQREIAAWLGEAHQIDVSHVAVGTLLLSLREQEQHHRDQASAMVRHVVEHLVLDLDALEGESLRVREVCGLLHRELVAQLTPPAPPRPGPDGFEQVLSPAPPPELPGATPVAEPLSAEEVAFLRVRSISLMTGAYFKSVGELRKLLETKLAHASTGADAIRAEQQDARARVRSQLARLAAARGAGKAPAGAGPDRGGSGSPPP